MRNKLGPSTLVYSSPWLYYALVNIQGILQSYTLHVILLLWYMM